MHCWVLVLSGSRDVPQNFFIDPLTGDSHAPDDQRFLGVESAWNHLNYYVNMQDCSSGCAVGPRPHMRAHVYTCTRVHTCVFVCE